MYEYDLFAVINHEGQINNGHYTNFARFQDEVHIPFHDIDGFIHSFYRSGTVLTMTSVFQSFLTHPSHSSFFPESLRLALGLV